MSLAQRALKYRLLKRWQLEPEGLLGGSTIKFGNNKPKSNHKTHRLWIPNIQFVKLYSEILDKSMKIKVTTRVLRTIDKKGGLDNYLIQTKDDKIANKTGLALKQAVLDQIELNKDPVKAARVAAEAKATAEAAKAAEAKRKLDLLKNKQPPKYIVYQTTVKARNSQQAKQERKQALKAASVQRAKQSQNDKKAHKVRKSFSAKIRRARHVTN